MGNKPLTKKELRLLRQIRNSIVHNGRSPSIRALMDSLDYNSPRSIAVLIEQLKRKGILLRKENGALRILKDTEDNNIIAKTVDVPLVGTVSCGLPIFAEENIEAMIPVSVKLAPKSGRYFLLRAQGDSMNKKGINNGDLVLIRQQQTANNGDSVVALIDDEATIKEFWRTKDAIILKPRSSNKELQPIILHKDFKIQGIVLTAIPKLGD